MYEEKYREKNKKIGDVNVESEKERISLWSLSSQSACGFNTLVPSFGSANIQKEETIFFSHK
jgi:hypothetical protein